MSNTTNWSEVSDDILWKEFFNHKHTTSQSPLLSLLLLPLPSPSLSLFHIFHPPSFSLLSFYPLPFSFPLTCWHIAVYPWAWKMQKDEG